MLAKWYRSTWKLLGLGHSHYFSWQIQIASFLHADLMPITDCGKFFKIALKLGQPGL